MPLGDELWKTYEGAPPQSSLYNPSFSPLRCTSASMALNFLEFTFLFALYHLVLDGLGYWAWTVSSVMDSEASLDTRMVFVPRYHRHHVLSHQGHLGALRTAEQFPSHCPLPMKKNIRWEWEWITGTPVENSIPSQQEQGYAKYTGRGNHFRSSWWDRIRSLWRLNPQVGGSPSPVEIGASSSQPSNCWHSIVTSPDLVASGPDTEQITSPMLISHL